MEKKLRVAIIQSTLDNMAAWQGIDQNFPNINKWESMRTWEESVNALRSLATMSESQRPHVIVLPEFGVDKNHEYDLKSFAHLTGSIIIGGIGFKNEGDAIYNKAIVTIPYGWPFGNGDTDYHSFYFGKRHPARVEKSFIRKVARLTGNEYDFKPSKEIYILSLPNFGNIGLAICADFYDIERYMVYQGRIQHLFLLAYNQDTESFNHLAESAARLIFCNVVICNTGYHGGSIAFSPRKKSYERVLYSHYGSKLCTVQTVELPVADLIEAQKSESGHPDFKTVPPGYEFYDSGLCSDD